MQYHIIIVVIIWSTVLADSRKIRGISLAYRRFYKEKRSFLCIDGSKIIPFEQVNDDYCDCLDASDEPGTSACTNGRFYCINLGFRPHYIQSSRVNDGICDCCDGSDEYNSRFRCRNTCRDLGQRELVEVEDRMRAVSEGLLLKQQLIKEGANIWQEKQSQLRDLQRVGEQLRAKMEAHRKRERKAEGMLGLLMPQGDDNRKKKGPESLTDFFQELDCNKDGSITVEEVQANVVSRGEEGRGLTEREALDLLGGHRQADLSLFRETLWRSLKSDSGVKMKEDLSAVGGVDQAPNIKAAGDGSADVKKMEEAYDTLQMEIRDLEETLSTDYGADKEFMYLLSLCVELAVYEYTYVLCPFNQVTQKSSAGTVLLGNPVNKRESLCEAVWRPGTGASCLMSVLLRII
ncbi:glucosidase 2 subunit beta-like isoform X2 [Conger conger]|uniref:glucosidase 2 subunit beta-like isoform X2 n=1 Tax=Conger conger TaxID=82655 RepID=UPI002A5B07FD|nr:glucosidase 2 subunit beta-like isoform X2 [Conger conger]